MYRPYISQKLGWGLLVVSLLFYFTVPAAAQTNIYQQLEAPFYDPNSVSTDINGCQTPGSELSGNTNGERVFNYFVGKGLSNESAAAITGNLQVESSFEPVVWGGGGGNYYGIAQWGGGRYQKLLEVSGGAAHAAQLNYQLDFIWYELHNGYESTLQNLQGDSSVPDKAIFWGRNYEVAVNSDGTLQAQTKRVVDAIIWFNKTKGNPTPTTVPTTDNGCNSGGITGAAGYSNPFHDMDGLIPSRIDEGVDYTSTKPVPIYAIGNGVVTIATDKSTFYTTSNGYADWITYQLTDGPAAGKYVYVSEACPPLVKVGDHINSDTHLCDVQPDSIETGWALDASSQAAAAYYVYIRGFETAYGVNFNQLLVKLGAPAGHLDAASDPSGTVLGSLPPGWPTW